MDKDTMIKREITKYKKMFRDIAEDKKPFAERMYTQAAFMFATLTELQETVNADGAIVTCVNGNGFEVKMENPAQKSYNIMIKNYNATIKILVDLLPKGGEQKEDELMQFIKGGKP